MGRVLVICETSGVTREAFRAVGHSAYSNDLLHAEDDSPYHFRADCLEFLNRDVWSNGLWDLIVLHPECTALCVSGNAHYAAGKPKHQKRLDAIAWTLELWETAKRCAPRVCLENPVGVLPRYGLKPTQYVQPWEYGHPEAKRTALYLHGLPKLRPTNVLPKPPNGRWDNQTPSGQNKLGPSPDRWKIRSRTYSGWGLAMAHQWGPLLDSETNPNETEG